MERTRKVYPHIDKINDHAEALRNQLVKYAEFVSNDRNYYCVDGQPSDDDDLLAEYDAEFSIVLEAIAMLKQFIPD